jgi:uncharacterized protein YceH (UPF0502 family)
MSDIGETATTGNPDRDAVAHLARRMRLDTNLAYQIGFGTASFERIVAAEAAAAGCPAEEMKRHLMACVDREPAEIPALRQRVSELEEEVARLRRQLDPLAARQLPLFDDGDDAHG